MQLSSRTEKMKINAFNHIIDITDIKKLNTLINRFLFYYSKLKWNPTEQIYIIPNVSIENQYTIKES